MSKLFHPSRTFILFCLTCLQGFGLYFFLKGFLLTRQTLDIQATQSDIWDSFPLSNTIEFTNDNNNSDDHPPTIPAKPPFDRVIIIVIDALRFDFVTRMPPLDNEDQQQYYHNRLPIIEKLLRTHPSSSLLYQFRADPPTTTMQRIKGLMTGSLPTFIDAGANFASSAVNEDHLLRHVQQRYDNIYFMGDDTWVNLFPEVFVDRNRTFESDSFKMFDLHTVDNRILDHLWPIMSEQERSERDDKDHWQVAIAHFLGVDHCGHTYGPSHPNMANKLSQMNDVIERLTHHVDENTLLVVMGDHGMSVEGDHGGESVEELMSALFLYSGRQLTVDQDENNNSPYYRDLFNRIHRVRAEKLGYPIQEIVDRLGYNATNYPIASQIHLVPTLSYLLGVPIPFGNLGALLPDVLIPSVYMQSKNQVLLHMAQQFRKNALQVYNYLEAYWQNTQHPGFSPNSLKPIYEHLFNAEQMFSNDYHQQYQQHDDENTVKLLEKILFGYDTFLISTIKYCDAIWAQFDVGSMIVGITIMVLTACATLLTALRPNSSISKRSIVIVWGSSLLISFGWIMLFNDVQKHDWFEKMGLVDGVVAINCIVLAILFLIMALSSSSPAATKNTSDFIPLDWFLLVVGTLATAFTLASNSFVIWEDRGTRFIAATLCIIWFFRSMASMHHPLDTDKIFEVMLPPLLVFTWIRLTGLTGQCREEQFPYCSYIHNGYLKLGEGSLFVICFTLFNAFLTFSYLPRFFYQSIPKESIAVRFGTPYCASLFIVFIRQLAAIYQSSPQGPEIQLIPSGDLIISVELSPTSFIIQLSTNFYETLVKILDVYAPRIVYTITVLCTIFCILIMKTKPKSTSLSSCPALLIFTWSVTLAILQQPLGSTILLSTPLIIDLLATDQKTSTQLIRVALVSMIGQHLFFVTAHQATFTSLPWKAAFVGFDDMNYYGGATLVGLSTLAGYIMTWLGWLAILYHSDRFSRIASVIQRISIYLMILLQAIPTCLSAIFVLILRRHLMTWKIFAPRFMLQGLIGMGTSMAVTACEWLLQG